MTSVSVTASPGNLGVFMNEVPGEKYLIVSGLHPSSPLRGSIKPGDRLQAINGTDLKGWSLDRLAAYCKEQKEHIKKLDILQDNPFKNLATPSKSKVVSARKAVSPKSTAKRKMKAPPPMTAFESLRPPPPPGYQRKIVKAPPGKLGIKVGISQERLLIVWIAQDCELKLEKGDVVEGIDNLYQKRWTIAKFVDYCKETSNKTRFLHMLEKVKTSVPSSSYAPSLSAFKSFQFPASAQKKPPIVAQRTIPAPSATQKPSSPTPLKELTTANCEQSIKARADDCILPFKTLQKDKHGLFVRPAGQARKDMEWDAVTGVWVPAGPQCA